MVSVRLRFSQMWLGRKGACCGRKHERKRLIRRVKASQKSICITTDRLLLPQSFLIKVLLPQP